MCKIKTGNFSKEKVTGIDSYSSKYDTRQNQSELHVCYLSQSKHDANRELLNLLVRESPLEKTAGHVLVITALKAGCMVDNFPFANIRSETAILTLRCSRMLSQQSISRIIAPASLFQFYRMLHVSYMRLYWRRARSKQGKMYEIFCNRLYMFLQILISFNYYQETVGDSGLPKDSNTVVGKPQLGEKKCNLPRVSGSVHR